MHRIDTSTAENNKFVNGNATQGVKGTQVDADWLNSVQEEIAKTIEDADITLDKSDDNQLTSAIQALALEKMKSSVGSFSLDECEYSSVDNVYILSHSAITIPKGKILDVTLSFIATSGKNDYNVWVALASSPATKITNVAFKINDNFGKYRTTIRIITPPFGIASSVRIFGSWDSSAEGDFTDIQGSYRISY